MTVVLTGNNLTIEDLVKVARHGEKVELHPEAINCCTRNNVWRKYGNR